MILDLFWHRRDYFLRLEVYYLIVDLTKLDAFANRIRKIKEHDSEFSTKDFAERAQEIFIEAHNSLTK